MNRLARVILLLLSVNAATTLDSSISSNALNDLTDLVQGGGRGNSGGGGSKCEPLNVDVLQLCSDIGYNETRFPNLMKHKTQQEAALETAVYLPLVRINCSPSLKRFLCSMYAPPCIANFQQPLKPCREMCEKAKLGCESYMKRFSFSWPDYLECWRFPSEANEPCVPDENYASATNMPPRSTSTSAMPDKAHLDAASSSSSFFANLSPQQQQLLLSSLTGSSGGTGATRSSSMAKTNSDGTGSNNNNYFQQLYAAAIAAAIAATSNTLQMQTPSSFVGNNAANTNLEQHQQPRVKFTCPPVLQLQSPYQQSSQYYLMVDDDMIAACGMPCDNNLFGAAEIVFSRSWVLAWSVLCFASTLFTTLTFLIERHRFRYPERPIIFLSVCYLMIGFAYLIGSSHLDSNALVCKQHKNSVWSSPRSYLIQGTDQFACTLSFMCIYFFTMASATWWVVLTLTWFLAAGLKWGHEAIEQISTYFHLAAWTLPLVKLLAVLWMQRVDADVLAGVCFVGIRNMTTMRAFVLVPLLFYLILGTFFLLLGFFSLFRIRLVMKHEGNKTDKLEKFMVRIGVFSILYMVPSIIVICCLFYEQSMYARWTDAWLRANLIEFNLPPDYVSSSGDVAAYNNDAANASSSFVFSLFMLKYAMMLVVGITSGFWIWSRKTVASWRNFFTRCLECILPFGMTYTKKEAQV